MSGMPNKTCLSWNNKEVTYFLLLLCSIFTLHMPNCFIVVLLYALKGCFYFLLLPFLYMCKGMFLSLSVSTLYGTIILTLMMFLDLLLLLNV